MLFLIIKEIVKGKGCFAMLEKLSVDFVRKIFTFLTNGNAHIKFHTICMQNRDREMAANRPIQFGMKLLGYNVFYRIPLVRNIKIGRTIGKDYLTRCYLRLPVEDLASEILENPQVVCDVEDCLFLPVLSKRIFYQKVEEELKCPQFAKLRQKFEGALRPIHDIYKDISHTLGKKISCEKELELAQVNMLPNRYILRLLDIAAYHDVGIHLVMDSSYPLSFFESLFRKNGITWKTLSVSNKTKEKKRKMAMNLGLELFGVVSADFNGFIKPLSKRGAKSIYYRAPVALMKDAGHPLLSKNFQEIYDAICGARVFSGQKRVSFLYELGYLCMGPLVSALNSYLSAAPTVCYTYERSLFSKIAASNIICTRNSAFAWGKTNLRVFSPNVDAEAFRRFMQELYSKYPHTKIKVLSLQDLLGEDVPLLTELFGNAPSEWLSGAIDFCRDYSKYTQGRTISLKDAVSLYQSGRDTIQKLRTSQTRAISEHAPVFLQQ